MKYIISDSNHLSHSGVKGQKWGVRNAEWYPIANWEAHMRNARQGAEAARESIAEYKRQLVDQQADLKKYNSKDTSKYGAIRKRWHGAQVKAIKGNISSIQKGIKDEEAKLKDFETKIKEGHDGVVSKNNVDYMKAHPDEFTDAELNQAINRHGIESRLQNLESRPKDVGPSDSEVRVEKAIRDGDLSYMSSHKNEFSNEDIRKVVERYNLNTSVDDLVKKQKDTSNSDKTPKNQPQQNNQNNGQPGQNQQNKNQNKQPKDPIETIGKVINTAEKVAGYATKGVNTYNSVVPLINALAGTDFKKIGGQNGNVINEIITEMKDGVVTKKTTKSTDEKGVKQETREIFTKKAPNEWQETSSKASETTGKTESKSKDESKPKNESKASAPRTSSKESESKAERLNWDDIVDERPRSSSSTSSSRTKDETIIDGVFREIKNERVWPSSTSTALTVPISRYSDTSTSSDSFAGRFITQNSTLLLEDFSKRK